ncbi:MAG: universal stress protein [Actinomycetales bacterium]|nr:universal stress protein [Actinomycetales bacterium]
MSTYSKILVPVAPDFGDETDRAVEVARALLAPGGRITVISVFEELPRYLVAQSGIEDSSLESSRTAAQQSLVDRFGGDDVDVVFKNGNPTRQILDQAEEGEHDCVVIASAQPGWQSFLLGSTASGVVRHARCAVHVLR